MSGQVYPLPWHTQTGTSPFSARVDSSTNRQIAGLVTRQRIFARHAVDSTSTTRIVSPGRELRSNAWYTKWESRLRSIQKFSANTANTDWPSPTPHAASRATEFLEKLHEVDVPPSNISQSAIGGIAFTFLRGDTEVFVEFLNNGRAFAAVSDLADTDGDFPTYEIGHGDFGYDQLIDVISTADNA